MQVFALLGNSEQLQYGNTAQEWFKYTIRKNGKRKGKNKCVNRKTLNTCNVLTSK